MVTPSSSSRQRHSSTSHRATCPQRTSHFCCVPESSVTVPTCAPEFKAAAGWDYLALAARRTLRFKSRGILVAAVAGVHLSDIPTLNY